MPNATIWNQSSKERMENVALLVARKGEWDKMLAACRMQQFGINLLKKEWKMLHYWRQGREREDDGRRRMGWGGGTHTEIRDCTTGSTLGVAHAEGPLCGARRDGSDLDGGAFAIEPPSSPLCHCNSELPSQESQLCVFQCTFVNAGLVMPISQLCYAWGAVDHLSRASVC